MWRVCGDDELARIVFAFLAFNGKNVEDLSDKNLLELRVKVRFWFFYENEMQRRPILFDIHPLRMKIKEFNDHIDDVVARTQVVLVIGCSTSDLDT